MFFDLLEFYPLSKFLIGISTIIAILYFVILSDSDSLIIDYISGNGKTDGPL